MDPTPVQGKNASEHDKIYYWVIDHLLTPNTDLIELRKGSERISDVDNYITDYYYYENESFL